MKQSLLLHNDISEVPQLGEWVEQLCEEAGLPMSASFQLNLALEEAVVNVMSYAYPGQEGCPVRLCAEGNSEGLTIVLEDDGVPFDPTAIEAPDTTLDAEERPIGGLGIFLVNQFMKDVKYQRLEHTNRLTMHYVPVVS